ncbi:MAG: ABC transporter ATP-binding protein [Lawsonibacter sp.]|jgi:iron(III) transport system ATP-binding protein|nr:ABC transporter ATP-binding protein [Lawsonibacter sp.]
MIRLNGIAVKFGDFTALHDIDVHVEEGEFFTFLGPSGCGKTTTLRTITGFIQPAAGSVVVKGKDITHVPIEERNIGIVFQSYALFPTMTVYDNIAFGLKLKKLKKPEIAQKVEEIARKVDLSGEQLKKAVSQLSGGQQQRVAIARALVTEPSIICMDEPLSNLDAKLRVQLRNELKQMQKDFGITTIYVTHDQEEALTLSDHIAVFNKGAIEQIGTPNEVYNHSATEFVCNFIGDIDLLGAEAVSALNRAGGRLDPAANNYIRLERIHVNVDPKPGNVVLEGVVDSREYYGLYIKYYIRAAGQIVKVIEKNDGVNIYEAGQSVRVVMDPRDVMAYPAT